MALRSLKVEIEKLKNTIIDCLPSDESNINELVKYQLESSITQQYLAQLIEEELKITIAEAVKNGVYRYFKHGEGAKQIQLAICTMLNEESE